MAPTLDPPVHGLRPRLRRLLHSIAGGTAVGLLRMLRLTNRKRTADIVGAILRRLGPLLPEHRIGRANLSAAFPDMPAEEIERILSSVWDNLGRVAVEFPHLDRLVLQASADDIDAGDDVIYDETVAARFIAARERMPAVFFTAHLANWEIPALMAAQFDVPMNVLFRPPSLPAIRDAILKIRSKSMGTLVPASFAAPLQLARAMENGQSVAMLVDQHDSTGIDVVFFGRTCKANSLLAQLARHFDCPVRGVRIVREADGNSFRFCLTEPLDVPRDAEGKVDVARTMQLITSVVEGWVREHPEQWLWLHRRWR